MRKIFGFLALLTILGCDNKKSFYHDYADGDLFRVPLIKPYQLITPLEERSKVEYPAWKLSFTRPYTLSNGLRHDFLNVTIVSIEDNIIYGGPKKRGNNPDHWFIIDTKTGKEMVFEDEINWRNQLKQLGCKQDTLYEVWSVFETFKKDGTLPWRVSVSE